MSKPRQDSPEAIIPLAVYSEHQAARVLQVSRQKLLELLPELRLDDRTWRAFGYQILDASRNAARRGINLAPAVGLEPENSCDGC